MFLGCDGLAIPLIQNVWVQSFVFSHHCCHWAWHILRAARQLRASAQAIVNISCPLAIFGRPRRLRVSYFVDVHHPNRTPPFRVGADSEWVQLRLPGQRFSVPAQGFSIDRSRYGVCHIPLVARRHFSVARRRFSGLKTRPFYGLKNLPRKRPPLIL